MQSRNHTTSLLGRAAATLAAIVLSLPAGCTKDEPPPAAPPLPEVQIASPREREVVDYLEYTGNTEALAQVDLRARVSGYLESVNFVEGRRVKKGELLFVIEKAPYKASLDRAAAEILARKATLAGAEADAILAAELADQKAGPEIDRIVKAARRDAAKAAVAEAEAALETARLNLSYCEIVSPLDGVISKTFVDAGNLVGQSESTKLATIVASMPIYVNIAVSETDMLRARRAQRVYEAANGGRIRDINEFEASIALSDEKNFEIKGHLDYVDPAVDKQTGTIGVRMVFENSDGFLLPGMFVRTRIPLERSQRTVLPQTAILQDQAGFYVLVAGPDGTVARKRVQVGTTDGDDRIILDGLIPSDSVIVQGIQRARVGAKVRIKQAATDTGSKAPPATPSLRKPDAGTEAK